MDPQTGTSGAPPAPVPLEQLGGAGAAGTYEEEAGGLPTPSDLGQLGAAAGPPEPTVLGQLDEGAGAEAPPEPASPEELAARIGEASSG